jgi:hypothetical protein
MMYNQPAASPRHDLARRGISLRRPAAVVGAALALAFAGCSDQPVAPRAETGLAPSAAAPPRAPRAALLTNIPVTGTATDGSGRTFSGLLTITQINYVNDQLVASGRVTTTTGQLAGTFADVPMALVDASQAGACEILNLDLGPIFLNLLGLEIDLSAINLDIRAVPGAGNLLGNLLCAIVHLLDGPGAFAAILNLLGQINNILAGLGL